MQCRLVKKISRKEAKKAKPTLHLCLLVSLRDIKRNALTKRD